MQSIRLLAAIAVALVAAGCSEGSGGREDAEKIQASQVLASDDGSLVAPVPGRWNRVPDLFPQALLTLTSSRVSGSITNPCQPGAILDRLPQGGAIVRVWEQHFPVDGSAGYVPRPDRFRLGPHQTTSECGSAYELRVREGGRRLGVSIWTKPRLRMGDSPPGEWPEPGTLSPAARAQLLWILDHLQVRPAAAEPIRVPMVALACGRQSNLLDCDRVWVQVNTRVRMPRLYVRIRKWSAEHIPPDPPPTEDVNSWMTSEPVRMGPQPLRRDGPDGIALPGGLPGNTWSGVVRNAGLTGSGRYFYEMLPERGRPYLGSPRIRAQVEVIGPRGRWQFHRVPLIR